MYMIPTAVCTVFIRFFLFCCDTPRMYGFIGRGWGVGVSWFRFRKALWLSLSSIYLVVVRFSCGRLIVGVFDGSARVLRRLFSADLYLVRRWVRGTSPSLSLPAQDGGGMCEQNASGTCL